MTFDLVQIAKEQQEAEEELEEYEEEDYEEEDYEHNTEGKLLLAVFAIWTLSKLMTGTF